MATTVTYKSSTLTTATNETKILKTAGKYMEDNVTITDVSGSSTPTISALSITPSTTSQTFNQSGVDGYKPVTVAAMSSGSATTPAVTITTVPSITVDSTGKIIATAAASSAIIPTVSAGYVSQGTSGTVSAVGTSSIMASTLDSNLVAGNIASGVSIFNVNGTYQGKLPVFNLVWAPGEAGLWEDLVDDPDTIVSITCNKTFQECLTLQSHFTHDAVIDAIEEDYPSQHYFSTVQCEGGTALALKYLVYTNGKAEGTILYQSDGTITASYGGDTNLTLNVAASGTYYPTNGVYTQVNVPAATTASASIYVDDHDNLVGSVVVTSAGWIPTQTIETIVDPIDLEPTLISSNVRSGVSIFGVSGNINVVNTSNATASAGDIKTTKTAYVGGSKITGSLGLATTPITSYISTVSGTKTIGAGILDSSYTVSISATEQAKIIPGNIKSGVTILGVNGSSTVFDTSNATISRPNVQIQVSPQVLSGYTAYGAVGLLTGSMPSRGTLNATISSKTDSVTISYGYYSASTVSIDPTEQAKIIAGNIKSGVTILGVTGTYGGGGGSGLEYEEGTYSPTADIARPTISFSKTHSTLPRYIGIQATSGAGSSSTNFGWFLYNYDILNSAGVSYNGSTTYHGQVQWTHRSNSTAITSGGRAITYGESNSGANTSTYIRYWATESNFRPYSASTTRYWRSGITYKWVAVW